ncbi:MAG: hypothetical protein LAO51_13680, partial [Acidobacteriia bacterium]|nr:hypothetical protein [Terriglobia bacterium]
QPVPREGQIDALEVVLRRAADDDFGRRHGASMTSLKRPILPAAAMPDHPGAADLGGILRG